MGKMIKLEERHESRWIDVDAIESMGYVDSGYVKVFVIRTISGVEIKLDTGEYVDKLIGQIIDAKKGY